MQLNSGMDRVEQAMRAGGGVAIRSHPNGHIFAKMAINLIEKVAPAGGVRGRG